MRRICIQKAKMFFLLIYITSKDSFKFFAIRRVVYTYTTTRLSNYAPLDKKNPCVSTATVKC